MSQQPLSKSSTTAWVVIAAAAGFLVSLAGFLTGRVAQVTHVAIATPLLYLLAICIHDSAHRVVHPRRAFNEAVG